METLKFLHTSIALGASFVFFIISLLRVWNLWGVAMPEDIRSIKRIEAIAYLVLSEVLLMHLRVKGRI